MAERVATFDWSQTPLGLMSGWPEALRIAVDICLASRFPMFVWWGPQLINIYNDGYVPMLGKRHPAALGRPARDSWNDIWDVVGAQADLVMTRGEATWNERVKLVMERNGYWEDTYFTWSYSPIRGADGKVAGLFCAVTEETERVRAEDALRASEQRFERQSRLFERIASTTPDFIYVFDLSGRFVYANRRLLEVWGRSFEQAVGRSLEELGYPQWHADMHMREIAQVIATKQPIKGEVPFTGGSGISGVYEYIFTPVLGDYGNVELIAGTTRDVTERRRTEARDRFLLALDEAVRPLTDPAEITAAHAKLLGEYLEVDRCAYADVETDQDTFNLTGDYTRGDDVPSIVGRYTFTQFGDEVLRRMRANEPFVVNDVDTHQPPLGDLSAYRMTKIQAVICVPLHKAGHFVAAMAVHRKVPRRWNPAEVELVQAVAARCWESIERGRVLRALRQSEESFRELADAMPQIVWVTRPDGYHEYYNHRWYEFTGVPIGSTDGEGWNALLHPDDRARAWQRWRQSLETGEPYEVEYRLRHHSGAYRWTLGRALPVRDDESGNIERWFGTCTDIDAMKRLTAEREDLLERERLARAEAERASEAKSEFLATLSHELLTPLTPVLLTIELMESLPDLPDELRQDIATIRRNVELESRLISDLLDLTRIANGKLQMDEHDVDLHLIVRSAVDICQREAAARLTLDLSAASHAVRGDSTRLQQIFWNLVNNAIKFTPPGGLITVRSSNPRDGWVRVEVSDTGAGIDAAVLPKLFSAFEQGDVRSVRQQAGLGLGLAISRRLAEAHGGTITATSAGRGKGSTFTVDLPTVELLAAVHDMRVGPATQKPKSSVRPLKVLLVEDHEPTLRVLEKLLREIGHNVTGVSTVASALAAARADGYDLLISDLGLPDGSGLDVMRQVRDGYTGRAIALTGYGMEGDIRASREAGFAEHLIKPVDLPTLDDAIRRTVERTAAAERR
jgi:PAS domain S-box-containing protein